MNPTDWSLLYKILLATTIFVHASNRVKLWCWLYMTTWFIVGYFRKIYIQNEYWYIASAVIETSCLIYSYYYLDMKKLATYFVIFQSSFLLIVDFWQFCTWSGVLSNYYISIPAYEIANTVGFEIILASLWWEDDFFKRVYRDLGNRLTVDKVILIYLSCLIFYNTGNY